MRKPRRAPLLALCLCAAVACGDKAENDVAELSSILSGSAQRSVQGGDWEPSRAGDRFRTGDGVRTSGDGGARLRFLAGGGLRIGSSTTIRFGPHALAVYGELEADKDEALVRLEVGEVLIKAGTKVRIDRRGDEVRFRVLIGEAVVTREDQRVKVAAGDAIDVEVDGVRIQRVPGSTAPPDAQAATAPPLAAAPAPPAATTPPPAATTPPPAATTPPPTATTPPPAAAIAGAAVVGDVIGEPAKIRMTRNDDSTALPIGRHAIPPGAELTVEKGGKLELARDDERAVVRGPAELVVAPGGTGGPLVEPRHGQIEVRAIAADVAVRVPGGLIITRKATRGAGGSGSGAKMNIEHGEARVAVTNGVVDIKGEQGGKERLLVGLSAVVEPGGGLRVSGRGPDRADFSIDSGLTATIHDPSPPTDVRIRFANQCHAGGVVEIGQHGSFRVARHVAEGKEAAIVSLGRGAHRYRVRCFDGNNLDVVVAGGWLHVTKDSGTHSLASQAPHNAVDADGRRYTVLYQNRLPSITFRWPGAPEADRYRLHIAQARGRTIELTLTSPTHGMVSGDLREGQYEFWYEAIGIDRESRRSTLTIDFDNAARSGYLQSPKPDAAWKGDSAPVSGAAIEGWRVAVGGVPLALDRQHRFSVPLKTAPDENGIAVEFSHPNHGVHLYVRRARPRSTGSGGRGAETGR